MLTAKVFQYGHLRQEKNMRLCSSKRARALVGMMLGIGVLLPAVAAEVPTDPKAGVEATLNKVNELFAKGGSAEEFADALYESDLTVTGEGEKALYPNLKSFMQPLAGYLTNPTCKLSLVNKVHSSGNLAVAWVQEHCDDHGTERAEDYRIIYVFHRGAKGWRATMEMFVAGKF
jgi:ketosteroid isomerase-like protein